jgi:hypothetical protein
MNPSFTTLDGRSVASNPAAVRVNPFRWLRYYPFWPTMLGLMTAGSLLLPLMSGWFWVVPIVLVLAQAIYWRRVTEHFRFGDRNPGLILLTHPLRVATATDMTTGGGSYPVLKVVQHSFRFRGEAAPVEGELVATVSLYSGDGSTAPRHWSDFDPIPILCATGERDVLSRSLAEFDDASLALLRHLVSNSTSLEPGLYWFDPETLEPVPPPP